MRRIFLISAIAIFTILSFSTFAFADDEVSIGTGLLEDMLATVSTQDSDFYGPDGYSDTYVYDNGYKNYRYVATGSRGSVHIIHLGEYGESGHIKTKYGVIDADSEKVIIPFKYDRIKFTPGGNFLVSWGQKPAVLRVYHPMGGWYSAVLNKSNEEIPLSSLPENAVILDLYEDGVAIFRQPNEEGFWKWGIIDIDADKVLFPATSYFSELYYWSFFDYADFTDIRTGVTHWSFDTFHPRDGYEYVPEDGKLGIIDRYGQIIIPPAYDALQHPFYGEERPPFEYYEFEAKTGSETKTIYVKDFITPSAWAVPLIKEAEAEGIVPVTRMRNYTGPVTRMELADMVVNIIEIASGMDINEFIESKGAEVPSDPFGRSSENILRCRALGIVIGARGESFEPTGFVTRAEMGVAIDKLGDVMGVDKARNLSELPHFDDIYKLSAAWSVDFLRWPMRAGIIAGVGKNKFAPDAELSTEQAIAMCLKTLKVLKQ